MTILADLIFVALTGLGIAGAVVLAYFWINERIERFRYRRYKKTQPEEITKARENGL